MASQCRCLAANPRLVPSVSSSPSCNRRAFQSVTFFRGQRLPSQRLSRPALSSTSRPPVQCVSSACGRGDERQQSGAEPVWAKAGAVFVRRLQEQLWSVAKWLAIPVLALSVLSELSYTLLQERVLVIPIGMICGIVFAGIMRETALELSPSIEERRVPWHLVSLGLLFVAFKVIAPCLPIWVRVGVPHFANGGLWQVVALVNDWRKNRTERKTVEQS